jgi:hypothetical protein
LITGKVVAQYSVAILLARNEKPGHDHIPDEPVKVTIAAGESSLVQPNLGEHASFGKCNAFRRLLEAKGEVGKEARVHHD